MHFSLSHWSLNYLCELISFYHRGRSDGCFVSSFEPDFCSFGLKMDWKTQGDIIWHGLSLRSIEMRTRELKCEILKCWSDRSLLSAVREIKLVWRDGPIWIIKRVYLLKVRHELCVFAHLLCFNVLFVSCWCVNVYYPSDFIVVLAHVLTEQLHSRCRKYKHPR